MLMLLHATIVFSLAPDTQPGSCLHSHRLLLPCCRVRSSSSVLLPTSQLVFRFHIQLAHISNAATTNASGEHFSYAKVNTKHTQEMGINSKTNKPNKSINNLINNVYDCPEELIIIY